MGDSQFIIAGTADTPYQNGLFLFNMTLPADYPARPPEVVLYSTGQGRIRMNPNLYANGKVCLSLLGTWTGPGWDSNSNLAQVLLAIQAQIMNDGPIRNEPGYEGSTRGTVDGYNAVIRAHTIKVGICDMLERPPPAFESMIFSFFTSAKKIEIAKQLITWCRMTRELDISVADVLKVHSYVSDSSVLGLVTQANFKATLMEKTIFYAKKALTLLDMNSYISML
jgi:baculoviral IAP repeat-containing protein 6